MIVLHQVQNLLTSLIILFMDVLEKLCMHGSDVHEEGLHGRVIGNGPTPALVALHAVHKYFQLGSQGGHKLINLLSLPILVILDGEKQMCCSSDSKVVQLNIKTFT